MDNGHDKPVSEAADTDTIIHHFYDKKQIVVNSDHYDSRQCRNT